MAYFKYTDNSPKSHHEYIFMPTSSERNNY